MKNYKPYNSNFVLVCIIYLFSFPAFSAESPQSAEAKQVVILVDSAATFIENKGKDAFPEFKKKDGEWYKGDTYIFVIDMNGTTLVNPASPKFEGTNAIDRKDANGKLFVQEMLETAKTKGSGWVDYWWPKPGEEKPSPKVSYIKMAKMPNGERVIVGSGIYVE